MRLVGKRKGYIRFARVESVIAGLLLASGCGYVGPPRPPALNIPTPVQDLRAMEFGDQVLVQFTVPMLTTEGIVQQRLRAVEVFAGPGQLPLDAGQWAAAANRYPVTMPATIPAGGPVETSFPARDFVGREIVIGVRITGATGRDSDWGTHLFLMIHAPLTAPAALEVANIAVGVGLRWTGNSPRYRVLRSTPDAPVEANRALVPIGETEALQFVDMNTIYGTQYRYVLIGFSDEQHQSLGSEPRSITPVDVFAPATPAGLRAEAGPQSVEVGWTQNAEDDFQSYIVRRAVDGGPLEIVLRMLTTPAYSDRAVEAGKRYRYTVSAIDMLGNESAASEPVTAMLP